MLQLRWMLEFDPKKRCTAKEVFARRVITPLVPHVSVEELFHTMRHTRGVLTRGGACAGLEPSVL